jgi:hypothetical protein
MSNPFTPGNTGWMPDGQEPERPHEPHEPHDACGSLTHYAGCACHERGWQNRWKIAIDMAARAGIERDDAKRERDNALSDWRQADTDCIRAIHERNVARALCRWAFPRLRAMAIEYEKIGTLFCVEEELRDHPEIFGDSPTD